MTTSAEPKRLGYPGDGDWTRLFSDILGPDGSVFSFVPAEVAHFSNDQVGRMRTLAKQPGSNVRAVSTDLAAMPQITEPADVIWLHLFYHDLHTALVQSTRVAKVIVTLLACSALAVAQVTGCANRSLSGTRSPIAVKQ